MRIKTIYYLTEEGNVITSGETLNAILINSTIYDLAETDGICKVEYDCEYWEVDYGMDRELYIRRLSDGEFIDMGKLEEVGSSHTCVLRNEEGEINLSIYYMY